LKVSCRFWETPGGSGSEAPKISRYGNYALHGKLFVFDRKKMLIGLDEPWISARKRINTEIGLIIAGTDLAQQNRVASESMVKPENC